MSWSTARGAAVLLAALGAAVVAAVVDRLAPPPAADVARGSEEAFASGLHLREIPPGGRPQRWTGPRATVLFHDVPAGPGELDVAVRGHRGPVAVVFDGMLAGQIAPGQQAATFPVVVRRRGAHAVELRVEPFVAGDGRTLGALLQHVRLRHTPAGLPSLPLVADFALPAAALALATLLSGMAAPAALAAGLAAAAAQAALLWPQGLVRSGLTPLLGVLIAAAAVLAATFARWCERRWSGSAPWAFVAVLAAFAVQGLVASWPLLVASDAVFHANNLARVAGGDYFITSVTQHAQPFRFPYGVSFYAVLAPLARRGVDTVALVRVGAAVAAVCGSLALFLVLAARSAAARAGLAVVLLQLLPVTLDVHSHGNLSNVFGQAATAGFFAWWAGGTPLGWPLGALLFAAGTLGHFSSLIVLAAFAAALAIAAGRGTGRTRALALAVGGLVTVAYYSHFVPLIAGQVPRLLEGGGQGRGASTGAWAALRAQLVAPVLQWGVPAIVLAWLGRPRPGAEPPGAARELDRGLAACWLAGAALAVAGVLSPLEVRYLYALTVPLAAAAAAGTLRLWARPGVARAACALLVASQAALAAFNAADALLRRYR